MVKKKDSAVPVAMPNDDDCNGVEVKMSSVANVNANANEDVVIVSQGYAQDDSTVSTVTSHQKKRRGSTGSRLQGLLTRTFRTKKKNETNNDIKKETTTTTQRKEVLRLNTGWRKRNNNNNNSKLSIRHRTTKHKQQQGQSNNDNNNNKSSTSPDLPLAIVGMIFSFLDRMAYNQMRLLSKEMLKISQQQMILLSPPWPASDGSSNNKNGNVTASGKGRFRPATPLVKRNRGRNPLVTSVAVSSSNGDFIAIAARDVHLWHRQYGGIWSQRTPNATLSVGFSQYYNHQTKMNEHLLIAAGLDDVISIWRLLPTSTTTSSTGSNESSRPVVKLALEEVLEEEGQDDSGITHIVVPSEYSLHFITFGYDGIIRLWKITVPTRADAATTISSSSRDNTISLQLLKRFNNNGLVGYDTVTVTPNLNAISWAIDKYTVRILEHPMDDKNNNNSNGRNNNNEEYKDIQCPHRITTLRYVSVGNGNDHNDNTTTTLLMVGMCNGTIQFYNTQTNTWHRMEEEDDDGNNNNNDDDFINNFDHYNLLVEKKRYINCSAFSTKTNYMAVAAGPKVYLYHLPAAGGTSKVFTKIYDNDDNNNNNSITTSTSSSNILCSVLQGHSDRVESLTFDPTGRYLISGGDRSFRIWDSFTYNN